MKESIERIQRPATAASPKLSAPETTIGGCAQRHQAPTFGSMAFHRILAGTTVTLALLSGCGGGSGGATSSASPRHSNSTLSPLALSQCVRAHGRPDFPDPTQAPDGSWQFPPSADGQELPAACAALKRRLGGQGATRKPASEADMAKLRQFAQCMRRHGLPDWPDPKNDGSFALPSRISQGGKAVDRVPMQACRQYLPAQGLTVTEPGQ
jgi:hypothetical protein